MMSEIMLTVVMQSVIVLSVTILNVVVLRIQSKKQRGSYKKLFECCLFLQAPFSAQSYETFYGRNFLMFLISCGVYPL
jgi:hypothetical protein